MNKQIFLDCDGVLADFNKGFTSKIGISPNAYQELHGVQKFWLTVKNIKDFYANLPLMPEALTLFILYYSITLTGLFTVAGSINSMPLYSIACSVAFGWPG